jgi:hypothetical protein
MIAGLFIDPRGPYPELDGVDCWDSDRDARLYRGTAPVVAHPPCHLWTNLACVNYKRYGGEHNRPGNDRGCFQSALISVALWGGVLEHPAFSRAWPAYGLPRPGGVGWSKHGRFWVCEVWQSAYGHKARKRTWLLYCGQRAPFELNWSRQPGTHQCGWFDRNKPTLGKREASATPVAFAEELVELARWSR